VPARRAVRFVEQSSSLVVAQCLHVDSSGPGPGPGPGQLPRSADRRGSRGEPAHSCGSLGDSVQHVGVSGGNGDLEKQQIVVPGEGESKEGTTLRFAASQIPHILLPAGRPLKRSASGACGRFGRP